MFLNETGFIKYNPWLSIVNISFFMSGLSMLRLDTAKQASPSLNKYRRRLATNQLEELLGVFPTDRWNIHSIFDNPNITMKIVRSCAPEEISNYSWILSTNPAITWEIVKANPDIEWDYASLSRNSSITWEVVDGNPFDSVGNLIPWCYKGLSANPNTTWERVLSTPEAMWDYGNLSANPSIPIDVVLATPDEPGAEWDAMVLCCHTKEVSKVLANSKALYVNTSMHYEMLSCNRSTTLDIVLANPSEWWDWGSLSCHDNITWEMMNSTEEVWEHHTAIINANVTWKIIKDNPGRPWDFDFLAGNPNITAKFVVNHPDIPWDFEQMSTNQFDKNPVVRARLERLAAEEDHRIAASAEALEEVLPPVLGHIILEYVFM